MKTAFTRILLALFSLSLAVTLQAPKKTSPKSSKSGAPESPTVTELPSPFSHQVKTGASVMLTAPDGPHCPGVYTLAKTNEHGGKEWTLLHELAAKSPTKRR